MVDVNKIATEVATQILKEENMAREKVVVYSGRFQPFHKGHYKVYDHLVDKFGRESVYIGTSDKVSKPRSPFTFNEKKRVMMEMFDIPRDKIVQVKNPYAPKEILRKFDKTETAYITVVGKKDKGRLGGSYFEEYTETKDLLSYEDKGYIYVAPSFSDISGTDVRNKLGEPSTSKDIKRIEFEKIYGKFDDDIFNLLTNRLTESVVLEWIIKRGGKLFEMPKSAVDDVDNYADKQLEPIDIDLTSKHFFKRLNDPRNEKDISKAELIGFFKRLKRDKKQFIDFLKKYKEIVVSDERTNINIPFMKKANRAIAKTVMRKDNFKTSNVKLNFEGNRLNESNTRDLIKKYYNEVKSLIPDNPDIDKATEKVADYLKNSDILDKLPLDDIKDELRRDEYKLLSHIAKMFVYLHTGKYTFMKTVQVLNGIINKMMQLEQKKDKGGFNRTSYYRDYIKGVVPENFNIKDDGNKIEIEVPDDEDDNQYWEPALGGGIVEENTLKEGGTYGHMSHPFDLEIDLTFGDLKNIVEMALDGELKLAREKTDGYALSISWRDDRGLIAARNKSHLKNFGKTAMDIEDVEDKFAGRGALTDAYKYAMEDLEKAISSLTDDQRRKIFKNGKAFMQLEVIFPESINVIPYGQSLLVFHNTIEYNEEGEPVGENQEAARILAGMIKQVNEDVQEHYNLQGPPIQELPKEKDLSKKKPKYKKAISQLQKEFNLSDNDGVSEYHRAWWEQWVEDNAPETLDNKTKMTLVKRWAFGEKGDNRINGKTMPNDTIKDWAKEIDKQHHGDIAKKNMRKFEKIFLALGAEVLSFMSSVLTVNPDEATRKIKKRLDKTIKKIKDSGDESDIKKLEKELERLEKAGGTEKLVPNEGIVFEYKGNTLKLTGGFAPLNQIIGMMYGR